MEDHPHQAHDPGTATRTAQDTDTSDVTRGMRPELAQGVIQPSSSDDTGDDVAMEGEKQGMTLEPIRIGQQTEDHDKERTA